MNQNTTSKKPRARLHKINNKPRKDNEPRSRLAQMRLARKLTLEDVAYAVRSNRSTVCRWERMEREPAPRHRVAYAEVLGTDVGNLGRIFYEDR